jgi:virginiamycin B lyase
MGSGQRKHLGGPRSAWTSAALLAVCLPSRGIQPAAAAEVLRREMRELTPTATLHLAKTADWVAITPDAVWVGSTGPYAVHRIDPKTNQRVATVTLRGEPCSGLATGFGSLWVPLCGKPAMLAKVDLTSNKIASIFRIGPAASEGGIATSPDSVWLVVDKEGSLARIDPASGAVRQRIKVPAGSYNPFYSDGRIWVTRAEGSEVASVDATTGAVLGTVRTGPGPRFVTAGADAVWTLNQGDGTLTRVPTASNQSAKTIALGTPGHGGDISFGLGMVWTTMVKVPLSAVDAATTTLRCQWTGPGGDSLGIGHGAIWLTDYHGGTIMRIELEDAMRGCAQH